MATLPVISISPYVRKEKSTDQERLATAEALHNACRDFGFFYLDISSFANDAEMETLMGLARQFFALPQERKDLISIRNEDNVRGRSFQEFDWVHSSKANLALPIPLDPF